MKALVEKHILKVESWIVSWQNELEKSSVILQKGIEDYFCAGSQFSCQTTIPFKVM